MKIIIDADACPVTDIAIKVAKSKNISCLIVCDNAHKIERDGVQTVVVSQGADAVDFTIISKSEEKDVIVTQDYGLASIVLSKGAHAINQDGLIYNKFNIENLLFSRHMSQKLRNAGKRTKGPKKRTQDQNVEFEKKLIKLLEDINKL
ncbi:MAG: YaiI/YqxD family protein [Cetobacterium sp.]|uniref:YaiI/YqxD family protein n=1 Tax=Cetobacterium sp. TaxID=2071632 RepID=UPI003F33EA56